MREFVMTSDRRERRSHVEIEDDGVTSARGWKRTVGLVMVLLILMPFVLALFSVAMDLLG